MSYFDTKILLRHFLQNGEGIHFLHNNHIYQKQEKKLKICSSSLKGDSHSLFLPEACHRTHNKSSLCATIVFEK